MKPHGNITLYWNDDLLVVKTFGPFNEIGLKIIISEIRDSILNKGLKSWRKLEIWDEETLGSPEVIAKGQSVAKWYKDNGCYASAIVICNCLQEKLAGEITTNNTRPIRNEKEAMKWLNKQST